MRICVRSGVAPTCQLSASFRVNAVSGTRPPGAAAGSDTMPRSSARSFPKAGWPRARAGTRAAKRSRGVSALARMCGGSATPNLSWTRSNSSASSRLPMPRLSNVLSTVTEGGVACGWTSATRPRTSARTAAARSSGAIGQEAAWEPATRLRRRAANAAARSRSWSFGRPLFIPPMNPNGPTVSNPRQENESSTSKPFGGELVANRFVIAGHWDLRGAAGEERERPDAVDVR